jgi:hypothetical protein
MNNSPCFESICLPGMTEEYRLNVFFHFEQSSNLKMIFVSEDQSPTLLNELEHISSLIFTQFDKSKITEGLETCERMMNDKISKY